ncbi:hypothetical protein [Sinorhizobium medicae]|uniref:hypothetical protein n=1 Tax=Sinorhizobium medicae TaxID=110321 RepID=UPI000FD95F69|nr:hypothetical protein [Sinorhizobium medicae]MDX0439150.1 hypothetical protein [Sinorhizobium medicae]MDX0617569.1 hypothetical protein [Sinorhizobium medicae]MDX0654703.1 hypothetical protein [Sinorhizobium medicae]MDX1090912.1 hypothetical protein [Sinorhizobium medicae]MDX1115562.1 hypothetical protein [Sinorhizobium medicae]
MMKNDFEVRSGTDLSDLVNRLRDLALALEEFNSVGEGGIQPSISIQEWVPAKRAVPVLVGRMKGHPTIKDGNIGATTEIFYIDAAAGLARSFNRWYRLGPGVTGQLVLQ